MQLCDTIHAAPCFLSQMSDSAATWDLWEKLFCVFFKGKLPNYFDGVNVEMVTFTFKAVILQMFQIHYVLC